MKNKKINKNLIALLVLGMLLTACSSKNKTTNNSNNSQVLVSETNISVDKNTDIMFLSTIYFDFDSYELATESKQNLSLLARYLKDSDNKYKNVILSGYCDELGSEQYNYELGLKRAEEAKNYLVSLGINKSRINIKSYGKDRQNKQSITKNDEENRKLNRKVVINLLNDSQE